ncbi:MAG: phospholipase D-like domain-containing protein [Candidatus Korarchaeota archaeon]
MQICKKAILLIFVFSNLCSFSITTIKVSSHPYTPRFDAPIFEVTCNVTTFSSPDSSYATLSRFLKSAESNISIMIYSISHPYLLEILNERISHGVTVTCILQLSHVSSSETSYTKYAAWNLSTAGASVYWANETAFRYTHAKFVIIDNKTVIVESANWAKTGIPVNSSYGNREWGIAITEPHVVHYFEEVFNNDLAIATPYNNENGTAVGPSISTGKYPSPFNSTEFSGAMKIQPFVSPDSSETAILSLLNSANSSIYVQQDYIYKNWGSNLSPFVEALVAAKNKGIDVRVIFNKEVAGNNETAAYLAGYGIEVRYTNTTYFERTHNKGVIVDGKAVLISSVNWGENSVRNNREAGVIIYNTAVAQYYEQIYLWDWSVAEPYGGPAEQPQTVNIDPVLLIVIIVIAVVGNVVYILRRRRTWHVRTHTHASRHVVASPTETPPSISQSPTQSPASATPKRRTSGQRRPRKRKSSGTV